MNVASLELCKELYELSGWENTDYYRHKYHVDSGWSMNHWRESIDFDAELTIPAYDLGYLLRKLPRSIKDLMHEGAYLMLYPKGKVWKADYIGVFMEQKADTPEDTACKLAIELFKQGILKKDGVENGTAA